MERLNVVIKADGTRIETMTDGPRRTTVTRKPCGCTTSAMWDLTPLVGGSGHSSSACPKHRFHSSNGTSPSLAQGIANNSRLSLIR